MTDPLIPHRSEDRIEITVLHDCQLKVVDHGEYGLVSISTKGLGIAFNHQSFKNFKKNDILKAELKLGNQMINLTLEVAWITDKYMGLQNKIVEQDLSKKLLQYFKAEEAALKLNEFAPDRLRADEEGTPYWYYGPNNCEVFYVESDNNIKKFEINYFGNIINMDSSGKIIFGQLFEENFDGNKTFRGTSLVNIQESIDLTVFEEIIRFIDSIKFFEKSHLESLKKKLLQTSDK